MKFKMKKCFKWTLITAGILAIIAWMAGGGQHHKRLHQWAQSQRGFQSGSLPPQPNLHNHFYQGGFHGVGFLIAILFWGVVIYAVLSFIRRRAAKRRSNPILVAPAKVYETHEFQAQSSGYAEFLDEWERNLTNPKEDHQHGNL